jgi:diguanylate cyclase (GGDEF)-like protein/PAS domain S-box-containing protein
MGSEPDTGNDHGLAAALAAHPDARVTAITPDGQFCPMPPELAGDHEVLAADSIFDLISQSGWGKIGAGWLRVLEYGSHVGSNVTVDGEEVSILSFDVRERFGVIVVLMISDAAVGNEAEDEQRPVTSRFGTYQRDAIANVTGADEGARGLLGWTPEDLVDVAAADLIHPDDQANSLENWLNTLSSPPDRPQRWRGRHRHRDGTYRWIEFTNTNRMEDLDHIVSEMMDISEEMAAAAELQEQKELLARLNEALPLGVCQIDRDRRMVYANHQLFELLERPPSDDLAAALADVTPEDRPMLDDALAAVLGEGEGRSLEIRLYPAGGGERHCLTNLGALHDPGGDITGAVICVSDITEATILRRQLEVRATFDQLTGCHNRTATMAELARALTRGGGTAAMFIDLDRFKPVNDMLGHAAGDDLLVAVAERLRTLVRDGDVVGRVGGDEFLIVCPDLAWADDAMPIARRIASTLCEPIQLGGMTVRIGASVGVAWSDAPDATPDSLVAAADDAMYRSKRGGRSEAILA